MILQKSARFLMIFLCAIMFHGNVFGEDMGYCYSGDNHKTGYGLTNNGSECKKCVDGQYSKLYLDRNNSYWCVPESECLGPDYCKRVVKSNSDYSSSYECQNTGGFYYSKPNNECLNIKECKQGDYYVEGYGITPYEGGYVTSCGVCGEGKSPQLDDSGTYEGVYVCKEIDQCASDTSCLTAGCGMVGTQCQQCSEYFIKIKNTSRDGTESVYNVCITNPGANMDCNENDFSCHCISGFRSKINGTCVQCGDNSITDEDNACVKCSGGRVADNVNNECVCPENQTFDDEKQKCVCKSGMGLNENNECETLGAGQIINNEGYLENCGFGRVPHTDKDRCVTCYPNVANENQTACVPTCQGQGYGKHTDEEGYSQCVKCTVYGKFEVNGVCEDGCGKYQENNNGTCNYCDTNQFYDFNTKTCVNTCNNSYPVSDEGTNVNVCCGEYQYFDDSAKECKSCRANQWFEERTCQSCPKNFVCNGKTKIKCPFGTRNSQDTDGTFNNSCVSLKTSSSNNSNMGFLHKSNGIYEIVSEATYIGNHEDSYYSGFEYAECSIVNGYAEQYHLELTDSAEYEEFRHKVRFIDFNDSDHNIRVCHQCKDIERANASGVCLCGQQTNTNAGLIKDIVPGGHGEICQVCPLNSVKKGQQDESYTCNPCPEGEGFYWNNGEYVCAKCGTDEYSGLEDTGLYIYTDASKNTYTWCLTHTELVSVMGQNAESYYIGDNNVWTDCPAGSCCLEGKKYSCKKGTVSPAQMMCDKGTPGQCFDCGGKTTENEGTPCDVGLSIDNCKTNMCTVSIVPTTFCIGLNSVKGMCFEIEKIKMSLKEGAGVYNTTDITGKNNSGQ